MRSSKRRQETAPDWYQGFPESRGFAHRDWERERDYWNPASESRLGGQREDYGHGREDDEPSVEDSRDKNRGQPKAG